MLQKLNRLRTTTVQIDKTLIVPSTVSKVDTCSSDPGASSTTAAVKAAPAALKGQSQVQQVLNSLSSDFMVIAADGTPWDMKNLAETAQEARVDMNKGNLKPKNASSTASVSATVATTTAATTTSATASVKTKPAVKEQTVKKPVSTSAQAAPSSASTRSVKAVAATAAAATHPGWRFRPPTFTTKATYTVKKGDSLSTIASMLGSTISELMGVNGLKSSMIKIGQVIRIPNPVDTKVVSRSWPGSFDRNVWLLARVIHGEARGEPYEGQVAVGAVVLNRLMAGFGRSIDEVISQKGAFTAVQDGQYRLRPSYTSIKAAQEALEGWDPSGGALYYYNPKKATARWSFNRPQIKRIGDHIFTL